MYNRRCQSATSSVEIHLMVGKKLRALREAQDLSRAELAQRAGVSAETVEAIEMRAERDVRLATLRALAKALGVQPAALI